MARNDAFRELRKVREQAGGAPQHYRSTTCEVRGCSSGKHGGKGKPDIAIHDAEGNVMGWTCEACYDRVVCGAGRDTYAKVRGDAPFLTPELVASHDPGEFEVKAPIRPQLTFDQQRGAEHIADVLRQLGDSPEFDRYADSMGERDNESD